MGPTPTPRAKFIVGIAVLLLLTPALTALARPLGASGGPNLAGVDAGAERTLEAPNGEVVTIETDAYGVPHIYADSEYALFYANGYVQARERLFQMDLLRHVGYGDAASVAGPSLLASDMQVRQDLYSRAELAQMYAEQPPELQHVLQAYTDGVNRFMGEATAQDALPAEFAALGHAPEPWTPVDSVASIVYLIGFFGVAGGQELDNAQLLATMTDRLGSQSAAYDALGDVSWLNVTDSYTTIPKADRQVDGGEAVEDVTVHPSQLALAEAALRAEPWDRPADAGVAGTGVHFEVNAEGGLEVSSDNVPSTQQSSSSDIRTFGEATGLLEEFKWGSNALLVNGSHTATGEPIMFGGPQMAYYKPPVPFEVGLHGAGYDVSGMGVATAPGVVIGRTADFAWSVTSGIDDQVDTVALELDPDDRHRYLWDGEYRSMDCREEVHRVNPPSSALSYDPEDADSSLARVVVQEVCRAEGMPVVAWSPEDDVAWAQRTTTRFEELDGAAMWLQLGAAEDLEDFKDRLRDFPFTFNFNYAGPEGIAYLHTGDVPIRADGFDPRLPRPAGSQYAWQGELVGDDLGLWATDPSTGYFAQWNNAPALGWRAGDSPYLWGEIHRVETLDHFVQLKLQETNDQLAWEDVRSILELAATHDNFARHHGPILVDAASSSSDTQVQAMADTLEAWGDDDYAWADADGDGLYDHVGHTVYDAVRHELQARVFGDEMGAENPSLTLEPPAASHTGDHGPHSAPDVLLAEVLRGEASHDWCDDVGTSIAESCDAIILDAFEAAADTLEARYGTSDVSQWQMEIHTSKFAPMGAFSGEEIPMVNRGSWNQVVSIGQGLDESGSVLPPANSGLITADELLMSASGQAEEPERLTSQLDLYRNFEFKPFPWTAQQVDDLSVRSEDLVVPGIPGGSAS